MICEICGRDINAIGQDNMSHIWGCPICEDCADEMTNREWARLEDDSDYEQ